ncbi:MAG TPA: class E sortase [Acidimicrobiales bacterium]|nr:class E sortase [Acidimicrobiales bacterium]
MQRARRVLVGAVALVLAANLFVLTSDPGDVAPVTAAVLPGEDLAAPARDIAELDATTTTTTTAPPTTTTTGRPIDPPKNAYQAEPHVVLGQIDIPRIGLSVPLNQGISLTSIDRGPSHWPGTALPGTSTGNVVIAGHRVTKTKPFRNIDTLLVGDHIGFTVNGVKSVYEVYEHEVVTPTDTWIVNQTEEPIVTLFACHPPGSARYRYVVRARLVSSSPA